MTRRLGYLRVLGVILVLSPVSRFLYHEHATRTGTVGSGFGFYTWNNLDGLAIGAIVAILVRREGWDRKQLLRLSILLMTVAVLMAVAGYPFGILTRQSTVGDVSICSLELCFCRPSWIVFVTGK